MKPEVIYQELKDLAEKLDITVSEQNLRMTRTQAKSGLCKVKGRHLFVMDKHQSMHKKIQLLAGCLSQMPHEDVYVVPAIRELLQKFADR
jgi:hypothetical protein